jgi:hypothetical protein
MKPVGNLIYRRPESSSLCIRVELMLVVLESPLPSVTTGQSALYVRR